MVSLQQIEQELISAIKSRNQVEADTLRGLKTRVQNEQIAKTRELTEAELIALVQSEVKRRKEAADSFRKGDRNELADKELVEAELLTRFLPAQASEAEISQKIEALILAESWTQKDFGKAMGLLKQQFGATADGATLSKILKEKLKS